MDLIYDKDIERLLEASAKLEEAAKKKAEAAEELISKRYGPLGAAFAAAIGINRTNFPKKTEDQEALVKEVVSPWLETHPDGWVPKRRRRGKRAQTVEVEQVEEPVVEVEEIEEDEIEEEEIEDDIDFSEDDDIDDEDSPSPGNLFGNDPFEQNWPMG